MTTAQKYAQFAALQAQLETFKSQLLEDNDTAMLSQLANYLETESETINEEIEEIED